MAAEASQVGHTAAQAAASTGFRLNLRAEFDTTVTKLRHCLDTKLRWLLGLRLVPINQSLPPPKTSGCRHSLRPWRSGRRICWTSCRRDGAGAAQVSNHETFPPIFQPSMLTAALGSTCAGHFLQHFPPVPPRWEAPLDCLAKDETKSEKWESWAWSLHIAGNRNLQTRPVVSPSKNAKTCRKSDNKMYKKCDRDTLFQCICCAAQTHGIGVTFFQVLQKLKDDRPSDGTTTGTKGGTVADDLAGVGDTQKNAWLFPKRFLKTSFWTFGFGIG